MSKVTKKLQVSIPKSLADRYGIRAGDDLEWEPAGDNLRVRLAITLEHRFDLSDRVRLFDEATERQLRRQAMRQLQVERDRGWTREELYSADDGPG
jgi:AbrB family looped-hinge helix DNA binding protein